MRAIPTTLLVVALLVAPMLLLTPAHAREGELAAATFRESIADGVRVEWNGLSAIELTLGCVLGACVANDSVDGRYHLPSAGSDGSILLWWDAADKGLKTLRVQVAGHIAEGTSPIRIDLPGSAEGEYRVHVEPVDTVVGGVTQQVHWRASFRLASAVPAIAHEGESRFTAISGCALILCDAAVMDHESGAFNAPWRVRGTLVAAWPAGEGERRVSIPGTAYAIQGPPPLTLRLDELPAGEWAVQVDPVGLALPLEQGVVSWEARIERAP